MNARKQHGMIYGPIWLAGGEKNNVDIVKIIISDGDIFQGLCHGDGLLLVQRGPFEALVLHRVQKKNICTRKEGGGESPNK